MARQDVLRFQPVFGEDIPEAGDTVETMKDRKRIRLQQEQQRALRRKALEEQKGIQATRLEDLTNLLAQEEQRKFTQAIPEIAETAQAGGFLETSGFGGALARERSRLAGETAFRLGEQSLADREFEIGAVGDIAEGTIGLGTAGLEREFSVEDLTRSENLARELARIGRPVPQQVSSARGGSNVLQGGLGGAAIGAQVGGGPGAAIGAGAGIVAGIASNQGGGTYLCTHLKNLGLMTFEEVQKVHEKVFPSLKNHLTLWFMYHILAPIYIKHNLNIDWVKVKPMLCDDIINSSSNEEAFQKYKSVCVMLFTGRLNLVEVK